MNNNYTLKFYYYKKVVKIIDDKSNIIDIIKYKDINSIFYDKKYYDIISYQIKTKQKFLEF